MKPAIIVPALAAAALGFGVARADPAPAMPVSHYTQADTLSLSKATLSAKGAQAILNAAQAEAAKNHWAMSIAVVDDSGRLLAFLRMDGVPLGTIDVAQGKALTAVKFEMPTKIVQDMVNKAGPAFTTVTGITALTGGYPILVDGKVVGAIGASGGFNGEDDLTAQAGLAAGPH